LFRVDLLAYLDLHLLQHAVSPGHDAESLDLSLLQFEERL
jgi:hypothetical protein